jgi:hypothetical protein
MTLISDRLSELKLKGKLIDYNAVGDINHYTDDNGSNYVSKWLYKSNIGNTYILFKTDNLLAFLENKISFNNMLKKSNEIWLLKTNGNRGLIHSEMITSSLIKKDYISNAFNIEPNWYNEIQFDEYSKDLYKLLKYEKEASIGNFVKIMIAASLIALILLFVYSLLT